MRTAPWLASLLCVSACGAAFGQAEAPNVPNSAPAPPSPLPTPTPPPLSAPAVTISGVAVSGNTLILAADILSVVSEKAGQAFDPAQYQKDADAIVKLYSDRGFQAEVAPSPTPVDAGGNVVFNVVEATVESIGVRGNKKTRRATVLRVIDTRPGQLYRRDTAEADVRNLYNLGIFEDVTYRLEPGSSLGRVQVVYSLREAKTGQISAGLSYSGSSGIIGQVQVLETNLAGQANALGAFIQSGGKYYRSGGQLTFRNPFVAGKNTALDLGLYGKTIYRFTGNDFFNNGFDTGQGYDEFRTGGDFTLSRRFGPSLRGALGFRGNSVKAHYSYDLFDTSNPDPFSQPFIGVARNPNIPDGSLYTGTVSVANDHRDYSPDPGNGGVQVLALEAGRVKTDSQDFLTGFTAEGEGAVSPVYTHVDGDSGSITRLSFDVRQYFSHGRTEKNPNRPVPIIAARLTGGAVSGTVPYWEQFFAGGIGLGGVHYARFLSADTGFDEPFVGTSQPLRGYSEGRFWGRNVLVGTLEYRRPIGEGLRGVLFVDTGDAWRNDVNRLNPTDTGEKEQDNAFKLHSSVGVGLRITTPIGPIRIDLGVGSEGTHTHFSIGQVF